MCCGENEISLPPLSLYIGLIDTYIQYQSLFICLFFRGVEGQRLEVRSSMEPDAGLISQH